jgi:NADPH:quinone reductase-like Zn-dependent oxidoreductase
VWHPRSEKAQSRERTVAAGAVRIRESGLDSISVGDIQTFPLIPGIDLAGTVRQYSNPTFTVGDQVLVNGWT